MATVLPTNCPSCGGEMRVQLVHCPGCHTEVQGDFPLDRFSQLSDEQLSFLLTFLRCRGNLKDVGSRASISYPTARARLDSLLEALDLGDEGADMRQQQRLAILARLKNGEISSEDALTLLQGGKRP